MNDHPPAGTVLQEWQGYVLSVEDGNFVARLLDLTAGDTVESEEAGIPVTRVPEGDRPRIVPGGTFTWKVLADGRGDAASTFDFASTPVVTQGDADRAIARAEDLHAYLESPEGRGE